MQAEWGVGSGDWGVGSGDWRVGSGEWGLGSGEWVLGVQFDVSAHRRLDASSQSPIPDLRSHLFAPFRV
jgi:hypothetical protein